MAKAEYTVDFPTLWVAVDWAEAHCVIPDGFRKGDPFIFAQWQAWCALNFYRVKPTARAGELNTAFWYRRSQVVGPQKIGKAPYTSAHICIESVGPALFAGWARGGERWDCRDHGCGCGFVYEYEPGEAMGQPWPTPLIQITATSEEQTDNIYDALRPMIDSGPLSELIPRTGEEFIRLPGGGRIDVVTSSAQSRLGQRVTFVPQDETGIWTKANKMDRVASTQRRGLAGMGGRSEETTNAWDPNEGSVAQKTAESKRPDIFRYHVMPPDGLNYAVKEDRERIHEIVYADSPWVPLDSIGAEAEELLETDPAEAERFFGNRPVAGSAKAFNADRYREIAQDVGGIAPGRWVVASYDGALVQDTTGIVVTDVETGHQVALASWTRPAHLKDEDDWTVPEDELDEAVRWMFEESGWRVWRFGCDPQPTKAAINRWAGQFGDDRVTFWWTNQDKSMGLAIKAWNADMTAGRLSHGPAGDLVPSFGDELTHEERHKLLIEHVGNAVRKKTNVKDDEDGKFLFVLRKAGTRSAAKIDLCMCAVIGWDLRNLAVRAGVLNTPQTGYASFR